MKVLAIATVVSLGFIGTSFGNPIDSPGTVYIDGLPCNLLCQHYLEWSRQSLEAGHPSARGAASTGAREVRKSTHKRISKRAEPPSADGPLQKKTRIQAAREAATHLLTTPRTESARSKEEMRKPPIALSTDREPQTVLSSKTDGAPGNLAGRDTPKERSPQEVVAAAITVAEQMTNAESPKASDSKVGGSEASTPLVALVLSRPDIKSVSALKGLNVGIDAAESTIEPEIRFALAAAGATETRVSASDGNPLDRLIQGEVQAAIVKLVSQDAAEAFPDIGGFKVLRIPLFPKTQ